MTLRVVLLAPIVDGTDVGEAYVAYKWAEALSARVDLTVLSFERPGRAPLADQLPDAEVITWQEPAVARLHERFNSMAKPAWPILCRHVRRWMRDNEHRFDLAHQIMPQAARYPTPFRHTKLPYVIGPLGGALDTPNAFRAEVGSAASFTRLRELDHWRFRNDPWLRASYSNAAVVLGVAPYVRDVLQNVPMKRFEAVLELGIDDLADNVDRSVSSGGLRLLHVGRGVRTKGLRDTVRALAKLPDLPNVTLTSAGSGEEIDLCRAEADKLGVANRTTFLDRIPRDDIEQLYRSHDVFCFPSFREPAGGVLYEAMRWGLPVITAARGGPDWIVDDDCGLRIPVTNPTEYAEAVSRAIRLLATDQEMRLRLGKGAREKVLREGLWTNKASALQELYREVHLSEA